MGEYGSLQLNAPVDKDMATNSLGAVPTELDAESQNLQLTMDTVPETMMEEPPEGERD